MAKLLSGTRIYGNATIDSNLAVGSVGAVSGQFHTITGNISQVTSGGAVYLNTSGNILATGLSVFGNTRIGSLAVPGALHTIIGNVDVSGAGTEFFNIGGNVMAIQGSFGSINSTGLINTTGNVLATTGVFNNVIVNTGNVNAVGGYFVGNGYFLTGIVSGGGGGAPTNLISQGGSNVIVNNNWVNVAIAGANVFSMNDNVILSVEYINTTANISADRINASTSIIGGVTLSSGTVFRNGGETIIYGGGSATTRAQLKLGNSQGTVLYGSGSAAAPNVPAAGIIIHGGDGNVRILAPNIASGGSRIQIQAQLVEIQGNLTPVGNLVYNIGNVTNQWNTIFGKSTQAQYADLAEIYTTDQQYPAGTVVIFGGEAEVTQSRASHDTRIAGVVSTNPAYLMNSTETGVPVALQGRVPCRVLGPVSKGDRVVASHIAGVAQALDPIHYQPGCIIGKSLQSIETTTISTIEVVVGRL